jgi:RNA polymerase sigma factor (sigma-70 family)
MTSDQASLLLQHIRRLAGARGAAQPPDAQLLERFAAQRDEAAFTALVRRHGPMVLNVCRSVLRHEQDAEDAFQATFWVLARKAASIRRPEAVAGWLYEVAYHVAVQGQADAARRRDVERKAPPMPHADPTLDMTLRDLRRVLHEELRRLPDKYRLPLVLCYLEGRSHEEAAGQLGWTKGTFRGRLDRGREHLRRRLAARGVALSALLCATAVAPGVVKGALVDSVVRAAVLSVVDGAALSARVIALAEGVTRAMLLTKARIATAVLLAASLFAAGTGALTRQNLVAKETPQAARPSEPSAARGADDAKGENDDSVEVNGRVLDPDGKPFAGATLSVWAGAAKGEAARAHKTTTGKDGRFRLTIRRASLQKQAVVVATAEGFGLDWAELGGLIPKDHEVTLRLARGEPAINGRLLNLEGQGIAGAEVQVRRVEKRADEGDLAPFIATKQQWARGKYVPGVAMKSLPAEALPVAASATIDADGRFRLTGFGRDRVVHLTIRGKAIETTYVEVLTHPGPVEGLFTGNENDTAYGATFERVFAPAKSIVGTVREKGTGKPLAGISISCGRWAAPTDEKGQYRIDGIRKQDEYTVTAQGSPYFTATKSRVADTPAFEPVGVDFELERGLAIRGRVFNKATGKPVVGTVQYHAFEGNPHLKRGLGAGEGVFVSADGSFALTAIPGPGVLAVLADEDDYVKVAPPADWKLVPTLKTIPQVAHALVRIDPSEKIPESDRYEISLEPAASVQATVVGPDGKPFTGYYAAGLTASPRNNTSWLTLKEAPTFSVRGLDASRVRVVVLFSSEKKLGKAQVVRADEEGPLQIQMQPLSGLTGRILDADGRPWAGLEVRAALSRRGEDFARLPVHLLMSSGWVKELEGQTQTDADGKFRLEGLLPGLRYTLTINGGDAADAEQPVFQREGIAPPESGRIEDLGDLRSKQGRKSP